MPVTEPSMSTGRIPVAPELPVIGVGCAALGNLFRASSDADARSLLARSWERGIRYFDTAPHYGPGESERRLGDFLGTVPRHEVQISSKVGRLLVSDRDPRADPEPMFVVPNGWSRRTDFSAPAIRRSVEESLDRLKLDYLDLALLHDPDDNLDQARAEALPALVELRASGLVRQIGVGTNSDTVAVQLAGTGDLDAVLLAGRYTLLSPDAPAMLPLGAATNTRVIAAGIFNSGILASPDGRYDYGAVPPGITRALDRLRSVCAAHCVALPAAAVQFVAREARIHTVLLGPASAAQLDQILDWLQEPIPEPFWVEVNG
ncbi:aldo/keto reductase [Cryobacterium sp. SO2]|uniref:aldo/keto reductase n=1 Tax=Cryobacterium sp. SO2 TaxID=1897060 RepID=UPI00223DB95C|nr:aldo/keto reductase [Cryobacterium sp. SO2]WEO77295.1 aldo/keto reductase [Cryobacterium sp. SO2]